MSDNDLTWTVEAGAVRIALTWMVDQWERSIDGSNGPLDLQIIHFSGPALSEMCATYPILNNATEEFRWLIYFKGLLAADTHPRDQMLEAIDSVRAQRYRSTSPMGRLADEFVETARPTWMGYASDANALALIARALSDAAATQRPSIAHVGLPNQYLT